MGILALPYIDGGDLVPDQVTIEKEAEVQKIQMCWIYIWWFSLNSSQAEALDIFLAKQNLNISATVALEASDDVLLERLSKRAN